MLTLLLGCLSVYGVLFSTGLWLYGETGPAIAITIGTVICGVLLVRCWRRS